MGPIRPYNFKRPKKFNNLIIKRVQATKSIEDKHRNSELCIRHQKVVKSTYFLTEQTRIHIIVKNKDSSFYSHTRIIFKIEKIIKKRKKANQ